MLENVIAQNEISGNLNTESQKLLLKSCLDKYQNILNDKVYGFMSITFTGRIICKVSYDIGSSNLKSKIDTPDIQEFIKTGFLKDRETLIDIINEAKKIDTNE